MNNDRLQVVGGHVLTGIRRKTLTDCLYQALRENYKGRITPSSYSANCKAGGLFSRGPTSQTNEERVSEALENRQYLLGG